MKGQLRIAIAAICAFAAAASLVSCAPKKEAPPKPPVFYKAEDLAKARTLIDEGYALLDSSKVDSALAKFAGIEALVPSGFGEPYHAACAYARTGKKAEALKSLERLVANGYDAADGLEADPDFASLREEPRFKELVSRARSAYEKSAASFAAGLPEYTGPPDTFTTDASLQAWRNEQGSSFYDYYGFWSKYQMLTAQINLASRILAAKKAIHASDPEFDYGLERVRAASNIESIYNPGWLGVSDMVAAEVAKYERSSAAAEGLAEARYYAGMAFSLKYPETDLRRVEAYGRAKAYYEQVRSDSTYGAAAEAFMLVDRFNTPGTDMAVLTADLKKLVAAYPENQGMRMVIGARLGPKAVRALWPIAIEATDIDGKKVSLDQYAGKALLIDFWATWCGPCRQELPNIVKAYAKYHALGFEILSISLDYESQTPLAAYRDWIGKNKMDWRHIYDGAGWRTPLAKQFFVAGIPAPFLVGRDGSLAAAGEECRGTMLVGSIEKALGAQGK